VTDWYQVALHWLDPFRPASFTQSWIDPADDAFTGIALQVVGTEGGLELHSGVVRYRDRRPARRLHPGTVPDTRLALEAFLAAVRAPEPPAPPVTLAEAREATRVGLLVREAVDAGMGRVVDLAEIGG
jgi:hypothetical protein